LENKNDKLENKDDKKDTRIQKYISASGAASRRGAEKLVLAGRVRVNGMIAQIGMSIDTGKDKVTVDGKELHIARDKIYIALNKPRGYVTTLNDELGRKCVTELLTGFNDRVYPVGRLDKDSEGLLLLTDDGAFANALMHPSHHVPKVYRVSLRPGITGAQISKLEGGIELDGKKTAPAKVRVIKHDADRAVAEITLYEGRNRQIRRMCDAVGLEIARLARVAVGNVELGALRSGEWRELTQHEVSSLLRSAGLISRKGTHQKND